MPAIVGLTHCSRSNRRTTRDSSVRSRTTSCRHRPGQLIRSLLVLVIVSGLALPAAAGDLDDLAFLVGHWRGEAFGGIVEEMWLPAEGDVMHGVFRAVSDGSMSFSEFIQITVEDGGVMMRFAHFRPDYSTWEGDGPPMTLRLAEAGAASAVFDGVDEASPDRIAYAVDDSGALVVEVTGLEAPLRFVRVD